MIYTSMLCTNKAGRVIDKYITITNKNLVDRREQSTQEHHATLSITLKV